MFCIGFVWFASYKFLLKYLSWPKKCNLYSLKYLTEKFKHFNIVCKEPSRGLLFHLPVKLFILLWQNGTKNIVGVFLFHWKSEEKNNQAKKDYFNYSSYSLCDIFIFFSGMELQN